MYSKITAFIVAIAFLDSVAQSDTRDVIPSIFLPGVVSTNLNERDMAYFTRWQ